MCVLGGGEGYLNCDIPRRLYLVAADRNYIKLTNAAHEEGGVLHRNFKGIPHTGPFAGMGREKVCRSPPPLLPSPGPF